MNTDDNFLELVKNNSPALFCDNCGNCEVLGKSSKCCEGAPAE